MPHPPEDQGCPEAQEGEQPPATGRVNNSKAQGGAWSIATSSPKPNHATNDSVLDEQLDDADIDAQHHLAPPAVSRPPPPPTPAPTPRIPAINGGTSSPGASADPGLLTEPAEGTLDGRPNEHDLSNDVSFLLFNAFSLLRFPSSSLAGRTFASKRTRHDFIVFYRIFDTSFSTPFFFFFSLSYSPTHVSRDDGKTIGTKGYHRTASGLGWVELFISLDFLLSIRMSVPPFEKLVQECLEAKAVEEELHAAKCLETYPSFSPPLLPSQ